MVWTILYKELGHHIITARAWIFLIISTGLFVVNGLTFVRDYPYDLERYGRDQAQVWATRNTTGTSVLRKPNALGFCVDGNAHIRPKRLNLYLDGTIQSGYRSQYENFKLPRVRRMDWSFIICTIYALFCVLLTFDAISGERAQGTLRLIAANAVSRAQILLAKYLGVLVLTFTVLVIGGVLSVSIINLLGTCVPSRADAVPLMLFVLLSMLYVSLFISASLLVSALVEKPPTGLLVLLFVVVVLVFVVPNIARVSAGKLVNTLSDYEARVRSEAAITEKTTIMRNVHKRIEDGTLRDPDEITRAYREPSGRMYEAWKRVDEEYERGLMRRQAVSEALARISPSAVFQAAAESALNSGGALQKRLRRAAKRYQGIYLDYVESKVGEIVSDWFPETIVHLPDGSRVDIPAMSAKEYDGEMNDFPVFVYPRPSVQERVEEALFDVALLMLWNVATFLGAHVVFVRRDI